ncbi:MAG: GntR family transcriptional regulator [Verrucomicrobia bacterium]|nr:GntR family transcriptional regulator [Cytophagales bacterium]
MSYQLGQYNTLRIKKFVDFGAYLEADEEEILLPLKYMPENPQVDDMLEIFLYLDSEDRIIATNLKPKAVVDDLAGLTVVAIHEKLGVFADWGLEKDLLIPFSEQNKKMFLGKTYLIKVLIDEQTNRIYGSNRLDKFLKPIENQYIEGDKVPFIVWEFTDLGAKIIIDDQYSGLLFRNEIFRDMLIGDRMTGYVRKIRPDGKADVSLQMTGLENMQEGRDIILEKLKANEGFLPLNDDSSPEIIKETLQMSKKTFKKAIGNLFREKIIKIIPEGIKII